MIKKKALIFGITGQDGSYLASFLVSKKYQVYGCSRNIYKANISNLDSLLLRDKVKIFSASNHVFKEVENLILQIMPDEIYYLSGQSSVGLSFKKPIESLNSNILGIVNILEVCRNINHKIRIYYAGSSECFGDTNGISANELTPFHPQSPYAIAKSSAYWLVNNYRDSYKLYICTGILFNHESSLRPKWAVTQKIVSTACRIGQGANEKLKLGRLDISRDWGWAPEYVEAMWLMLQSNNPEDYVIATGETNTLEDFVNEVFDQLGLDWKNHVEIDEKLFRPSDIHLSTADPTKAKKCLKWEAKYKMNDVIKMLIDSQFM